MNQKLVIFIIVLSLITMLNCIVTFTLVETPITQFLIVFGFFSSFVNMYLFVMTLEQGVRR